MIAKNQIKSVEKCGRNDKIWGQRIWSMQTDIVVRKRTFQENWHAKNQLKRWECSHGDKRKWVQLQLQSFKQ